MAIDTSTLPPVRLRPGEAQQDDSYKLTGTIIALFVVETVAVLMRLVARRIQRSPLMWGDFLIPLAWLANVGMFVCSILLVQNGAGKHIETISEDQYIRFLIITHYPLPIVYIFASVLPKLAVLEIYIRFFVLDRIPRYISWLVIAIIVCNGVVNIPIIAVQCAPISFLWDKDVPGGYCISAQQQFLWTGVPNIVTDVIMMFLPMPLVWRLHSSARVKWGIFTTFMVGSIGLVFSILRFVGFDRPYVDGTFIAPAVIISGTVEPGVYLLAACFLTFRPLFRWIAHNTFLAPFFYRLSELGHSSASSQQRNGGQGSPNLHAKSGSMGFIDISDFVATADARKGSADSRTSLMRLDPLNVQEIGIARTTSGNEKRDITATTVPARAVMPKESDGNGKMDWIAALAVTEEEVDGVESEGGPGRQPPRVAHKFRRGSSLKLPTLK